MKKYEITIEEVISQTFEVESEEDNEKLKNFIKDRKYDKSRPLFHYNLSMYEDKFEVKAKK